MNPIEREKVIEKITFTYYIDFYQNEKKEYLLA